MAKEIVIHAHGSQARPYVSFTRKYNLGGYESMDVSVGLSDDCTADETAEDGLLRVSDLVQEQFEELCAKIEGDKKEKKK